MPLIPFVQNKLSSRYGAPLNGKLASCAQAILSIQSIAVLVACTVFWITFSSESKAADNRNSPAIEPANSGEQRAGGYASRPVKNRINSTGSWRVVPTQIPYIGRSNYTKHSVPSKVLYDLIILWSCSEMLITMGA